MDEHEHAGSSASTAAAAATGRGGGDSGWTRVVPRAERRRKKKEREGGGEEKARHDLTLRNIAAADAMVISAAEAETKAKGQGKGLVEKVPAKEVAEIVRQKLEELRAGGGRRGEEEERRAVEEMRMVMRGLGEKDGELLGESHLEVGRRMRELGETQIAITHFLVVVMAKTVEERQRVEALKLLVEAYNDVGMFDEAKKCEKKLRELSPSSLEVKKPSELSESLLDSWNESIDSAMESGDFSLMIALLEIQNQKGDGSTKVLVNYNGDVCTALHVAAARGTVPIVQTLLKFGADKDIRSNSDGKTAKEWAEKFSQEKVASIL